MIANVRELAITQASRPNGGRWLPIGQVLAEVLAEVRELVTRAGVAVEVVEPIPDLVVDASRVEIILFNLISNAAKYADSTRTRRWVGVGFDQQEDEGVWWLHVSDNGLGIPAEHHDRVFQRFFRVHPERAEGSRLGLAVVEQAVSQLGGRIEFQSEPGVGTSFQVSLPARERETRGA